MNDKTVLSIDGNEAAALIAYKLSEVCSIYPITPSSPMGEHADNWSSAQQKNLWGEVPLVYEMQSEGGVAGAIHGALQTGALATTFTASQGLLLMIPNMYKIAGELSPFVMHVAARSLAAQGLSIFGDHSDVMATRSSGFAFLCSNSPQQAHDLALIAHASTLESRIPFVHFFDGFRTSHEINRVELIEESSIRAMIKDEWVLAHRQRSLSPDRPVIRGTAQNPDMYFQGREAANNLYTATPDIVQANMDKFAALTGRQYRLFDYFGHPQAERVIVVMGSGAETVCEVVDYLTRTQNEKVGVLQVHLYRPFSLTHFISALPASCQSLAVLDRTKEPGSIGEPLYQDVVNALVEAQAENLWKGKTLPRIIGGRYGLSSREFHPPLVKAVFDELSKEKAKNHFTLGLIDDLSNKNLEPAAGFSSESSEDFRAIFYGLGSDGTVGANKNTIKIIGEDPKTYIQAYFVYDSKKSGSQTVSHLRFGPKPIRSSYLIQSAQFIACHHFDFIKRIPVLEKAADKAVFLLNTRYEADEVWHRLPVELQQTILDKKIRFYVIDANKTAQKVGLGKRTNTIMQTCFFGISGVLPAEIAVQKIKEHVDKTYQKKGRNVVEMNYRAIDLALENIQEVVYPQKLSSDTHLMQSLPDAAPDFVKSVTARLMAGQGELIPVSQVPVDGTWPTATAKWEKRNIADTIPVWNASLCVQCGNCSVICPHSVIRAKFYHKDYLEQAPAGFKIADIDARGFPEVKYSLQIFPEDCTSCGLCVEVCPAQDPIEPGKKAINMEDKSDILWQEKENLTFFEKLPQPQRDDVNFTTVKGLQYLQPLFEFPGACAGCGETPYLKLASQLFGDRMLIANATGCSSIYGGNLPTTPWSQNAEGRGPAWCNSLFEDNAEFGLGYRLSCDSHEQAAINLLRMLQKELAGVDSDIDTHFIHALLNNPQKLESEINTQRKAVDRLRNALEKLKSDNATRLLSLCEHFVRRSIWIIGGDGWAYDIGAGGLDHVLASGRNVNILVMDTEVYSNTGGQMSKATPLGAVAKFAAKGKSIGKKDLALQAIAYGNVYVARIALGANPQQSLMAMREAEAYPGTSIILAYSHCIAHGIDMRRGVQQQKLAVESGYWPLMRFNPLVAEHDGQANTNPFILDSQRPRISLRDFAYNELRYKMLTRVDADEAEHLMQLAEQNLSHRWAVYEEMASRNPQQFERAPVASHTNKNAQNTRDLNV